MLRPLYADLILVFVTLCWGLTFPLVENAVAHLSSMTFVAARCLLAALVLLPFFWRDIKTLNRGLLKAALFLGLFNVMTYVPQTISLETLPAARAAFLAGTNVVLVPLIAPFFGLAKPGKIDYACAFVCLLGLYLITGAQLDGITRGDVWALLGAVGMALAVVYLQKSTQHRAHLNSLAFYQILFTSFIALPFALPNGFKGLTHPDTLIGLAFCAVFATSLALLLQTRYQHYTTAPRAAMIFCLEPLFGALFGFIINHQTISLLFALGAGLIVLAILFGEFARNLWQRA